MEEPLRRLSEALSRTNASLYATLIGQLLRIQPSEVVLIDCNNTGATGPKKMSKFAAHAQARYKGSFVVFVDRPAFTPAGHAAFNNSCSVPQMMPEDTLCVTACSSYMLSVRWASMRRPQCSYGCTDLAMTGLRYEWKDANPELYYEDTAGIAKDLQPFDELTEDACQLDDFLMAVAAFVLSAAGKKVVCLLYTSPSPRDRG